MGDFIENGTLAGPMADAKPLPAGANADLIPNLTAARWNAHRDALLELREHSSGFVNVRSYGAKGDGVTDDTAAIQAAIDAVIGTNRKLVLGGTCLVSRIVVTGTGGIEIDGQGGTLLGMQSGSYPALLEIHDAANVAVANLTLDGQFNAGYGAGLWGYSTGGGLALARFSGLNVKNVKQAHKWGHESYPDALVSEISFVGGYTYGTPSVVLAIGSQTVLSYSAAQLIALYGVVPAGGYPAGWTSLPLSVVTTKGAFVGMSGGEAMLTQDQTGVVFNIQPIVSGFLGYNPWGSVSSTGTQIETASPLVTVTNPNAITGLGIVQGGVINITGAHGFHGLDSFPMIQTPAGFLGQIRVTSGNNFYSSIAGTRTQPNIQAADAGTQIYVDDTSFGANFLQAPEGVVGGTLHFARRAVLFAENCDGITLTSGVPTILKYTSLPVASNYTRWIAQYSASTGVFTVPVGGLKSVEVFASFRDSNAAPALDLAVYVNGALFAFAPTASGGFGGLAGGTFFLGNLNGGDTIDVRAIQNGGADGTTNLGAAAKFVITAWN
jgi:hypothetical protein